MTETENPRAVVGGNFPPLAETLADDHADLLKRRDDLLAAAERAPDTVDDDNAGAVGDFIKQLTGAVKVAEAKRVDAKEPFLTAGRTVQAFFKEVTDPLEAERKKINARLTTYQVAVEAAERRKLQEEARQAAERVREAEEALAAAQAADCQAEALDRAVEAEERAAIATQDAEVKPAELSRTRGAGSVSSLRTDWVGDLADRDTLDLEALRQHLPEAALKSAINSFVKAGGRELAGARIREVKTARVA